MIARIFEGRTFCHCVALHTPSVSILWYNGNIMMIMVRTLEKKSNGYSRLKILFTRLDRTNSGEIWCYSNDKRIDCRNDIEANIQTYKYKKIPKNEQCDRLENVAANKKWKSIATCYTLKWMKIPRFLKSKWMELLSGWAQCANISRAKGVQKSTENSISHKL